MQLALTGITIQVTHYRS